MNGPQICIFTFLVKSVTFYGILLQEQTNRRQTDQNSKIRQSREENTTNQSNNQKALAQFITQAMNGASVDNRCN